MLCEKVNRRYTRIKRCEVKKRPMADTVLASLEADAKEDRELMATAFILINSVLVCRPFRGLFTLGLSTDFLLGICET